MAKSLKDILAGVKSSKVRDGSTGSNPGVDYEPKAPAEQDFVKKHKTEVHADRVGNSDDVYKGKTKEAKYNKQSADVYEEAECTHTEEGKDCPVHGECACPDSDEKGKKLRLLLGGKKKAPVKEEVEELDEISRKKVERYVDRALDTNNERSISNLASRGGYELGKTDGIDAGEKYDAKSVKRSHSVKHAVKKLAGKTKVHTTEDVTLEDFVEYNLEEGYDINDIVDFIEENYQLDEVSKKFLEKYKKHALSDKVSSIRKQSDAEENARNVARLQKQGRATPADVDSAHREGVALHDRIQKRQKGLVLAQQKINKKTKSVKEETEQLDEIGDTAKGRKRLDKYISHKISKDPKLDKDVKRAYDAKIAAGQAHRAARKNKASSEVVRKTHDTAEKRNKIYWDRIDKVRKNETDVVRAQQRIETKGKNIKKPQESKTMVDKEGVRKTEFRRPGLSEIVLERHMTSAEKKKETALKAKLDPSGMKASMKQQYGAEKGKDVYFATIRKKAMSEDLAIPMLEGGKKKKVAKESAPGDTPITFPSGNVGDRV